YTAGHTTVPEAVQQACAEWVSLAYYETLRDPALSNKVESNAYGYADLFDRGRPPGKVLALLKPFRRHSVASNQGRRHGRQVLRGAAFELGPLRLSEEQRPRHRVQERRLLRVPQRRRRHVAARCRLGQQGRLRPRLPVQEAAVQGHCFALQRHPDDRDEPL